jgi:uncharacterized protein HemX
MKRLTTLIFAAMLALTLSAPAWSQTNTGATNQSKAAAKKQTKAEKEAAKKQKQADKKAKKAAKKQAKK